MLVLWFKDESIFDCQNQLLDHWHLISDNWYLLPDNLQGTKKAEN